VPRPATLAAGFLQKGSLTLTRTLRARKKTSSRFEDEYAGRAHAQKPGPQIAQGGENEKDPP